MGFCRHAGPVLYLLELWSATNYPLIPLPKSGLRKIGDVGRDSIQYGQTRWGYCRDGQTGRGVNARFGNHSVFTEYIIAP